jgi:hypothetical protein
MSFKSVFFKSPVYNVPDIQPKEGPVCEGHNSKNILLICKNYESQEEFLSKIMKAVNIDLSEDTASWDCEKKGIPHWAELSKSGIFKKVILFGIQPAEIGLHIAIPFYKAIAWTTSEFLLADNLQTISEDKNKKQLLWSALKEMFV